MTADKRTEVMVGAVVVIALVFLTLGLIWGKGINFFDQRQALTAHFADVRGLESGDPVMIRGIKKGEVSDIELHSDYVAVKLWINQDVTLYADLKVCVEDRELMGGKQIRLYPGTVGDVADLKRVYQGVARSDMMLLMLKVEGVLSRVDSVFAQIHKLSKEMPVGTLVRRIDETLAAANRTVEENRLALRLSLQRMNDFTGTLEKDSTAAEIGDLVDGMGELTQNMNEALVSFNRLAVQAYDTSGTAGRLVHDAALYETMLNTVNRVDSLILDIKRNPKKYLKVSVF